MTEIRHHILMPYLFWKERSTKNNLMSFIENKNKRMFSFWIDIDARVDKGKGHQLMPFSFY
jgi:hypothetical protein